MPNPLDFTALFTHLAHANTPEQTTQIDGMNIRLVRIPGGGSGRWDHHDATPETVIVWSGDFSVEFRDHSLHLTRGQCCVVPAGAEHRGTSKAGAEVILFQQAH